MRIEPTQAAHTAAPANRVAARTAAEPAAPAQDAAMISEESATVRRAHAAAASSPEVRADRVAELKAQMAAGTYQVDNDELAARLIDQL